MAYTTEALVRGNSVLLANTTTLTLAIVAARITKAETTMQNDLNGVIDFSLVASDKEPGYLKELVNYKATEFCLVYVFAQTRQAKTGHITYWKDEYNKLLKLIKDGDIDLEDSDGNNIGTGTNIFTNRAKDGIRPALGTDKYGEFKSKEDLQEDRPIE